MGPGGGGGSPPLLCFVHFRLLEANLEEMSMNNILMLFSSDAVEDDDDVDWARR